MVTEDVDCPDDSRCVEAACKSDVCFDTDGGFSIINAGAVNKGSRVERDKCTGSDSGIEYYCDGGQIASAEFTCPAGKVCNDGRCED
jgi:hypothetical protein